MAKTNFSFEKRRKELEKKAKKEEKKKRKLRRVQRWRMAKPTEDSSAAP